MQRRTIGLATRPTPNHHVATIARVVPLVGHEPIRTLSRHRRWDGKVWFAIDVIPDEPGATLRIGDEIEVLATRPAAAPPVPVPGPFP